MSKFFVNISSIDGIKMKEFRLQSVFEVKWKELSKCNAMFCSREFQINLQQDPSIPALISQIRILL